MPRETVRDPISPYHVSVGWERGKDVQIGLIPADDETTATHVAITVNGEPQPATTTTSGVYTSLWANLSRQGINDLIRLLRKARDAAYGRDE